MLQIKISAVCALTFGTRFTIIQFFAKSSESTSVGSVHKFLEAIEGFFMEVLTFENGPCNKSKQVKDTEVDCSQKVGFVEKLAFTKPPDVAQKCTSLTNNFHPCRFTPQ